MSKRKEQKVEVIVEYTEGYEQRFTMAMIKIWEGRQKRKFLNELNKSEEANSIN